MSNLYFFIFDPISTLNITLNIELRRFRNIVLENRLCLLCNNDCIEDEFHFVMQCEFHNNSRSIMFEKIISNFPAFSTLNQNEQICIHNEV